MDAHKEPQGVVRIHSAVLRMKTNSRTAFLSDPFEFQKCPGRNAVRPNRELLVSIAFICEWYNVRLCLLKS